MSRRYPHLAPPAGDDTPPATDPDAGLRALAMTKSYTSAAVIVFFLYWLFWLPGLIFNLIYLNDARRMQRLAGQSLPGAGCLTAMLVLNVVLLVSAVIVVCPAVGVLRR